MALTYVKLTPIFPHLRALFPAIWAVTVIGGIYGAYNTAVEYGHVEPYFPYISECGVYAPESYTFTGTMSWGAAGALILFLIKFKYDVERELERKLIPWLMNCLFLGVGCVVFVGLILTGVYQCCTHWQEKDQDSEIYRIKLMFHNTHRLSAGVTFFVGIIYVCLITISDTVWIRIDPKSRSRRLTVIRWIFALVCILCVVVFQIYLGKSLVLQPDGENFDYLMWNKTHSGYVEHMVGTVGEWALVIFFLGFLMTYSYEAYGIGRNDMALVMPTPLSDTIEPIELGKFRAHSRSTDMICQSQSDRSISS